MNHIDDSTIDPEIESQTNFFQHDPYHFTTLAEEDADDHSATTVVNVAAVAMMNFEQTTNSNIHRDARIIGGAGINQNSAASQESLNFLENALKLDHDDDEDEDQAQPTSPHSESRSDTPTPPVVVIEPKQKLVRDSSSKVSMVMVNPASKEGTNRLGRPRRSCTNNSSQKKESGQDNSLNNLEKSLISTFRVDSLPVSGPGSRGGRKKRYGVEKSRIKSNKVHDLLKSIEPEIIVISDSDDEEKENKPQESVGHKVNNSKSSKETQSENPIDIEDIQEMEEQQIRNTTNSSLEKKKNKDVSNEASHSPRLSASTSKSKPEQIKKASRSPISGSSGKKLVQRVLNFTKAKLPSHLTLYSASSTQANTSSSTTPLESSSPQMHITKIAPKSPPISPRPISAGPINSTLTSSSTTKLSLSTMRQPKTSSKIVPKGEIPGPLSAFTSNHTHMDLSVIEDPEFKKLAFGYPVKYSPYANDMLYILGFYSRFRDMFTGIGNIGVQDLEEGLGLQSAANEEKEKNNEDIVNITKEGKEENIDVDRSVSKTIKNFFNQLLLFALNRTASKPRANHVELVALIPDFGIPSKWRSEQEATEFKEDHDDPVDPNMPEFMELFTKHYELPTFNKQFPLKNKEFFELGLDALEPEDRLLLLKSVCGWALSNSLKIKAKFNEISNLYDSSPLQTYYIPKMFKYTESELSGLNNKTKRFGTNAESMQEVGFYSKTKEDPLWFRMIPFLIGEGTCFSGNFHLVKLQDYDLCFETFMDHTKIDKKQYKTWSSRFKLYVEDFVNGRWYEVCDDLLTLKDFSEYLKIKIDQNSDIKLNNCEKLHSNLLNFAGIIEKLEAHRRFDDFAYNNSALIIDRSDGRITRSQRKRVDYNEESDEDEDDGSEGEGISESDSAGESNEDEDN